MLKRILGVSALLLSIGAVFALAEASLHPRCAYCGALVKTEELSNDGQWREVRHQCTKCNSIRTERLRIYSWNSW